MSEPKRYYLDDYGVLIEHPAGEYVLHADYARLRMERIHDLNQIGGLQEDYACLLADHNKTEEHNMALYERLQDLNGELFNASCANANMHKENARLKAEVERLRKAGDAMANWFCPVAGVKQVEAHIAYDAWNAAKEGKPSV